MLLISRGEWRRLHNEEPHSLYCSPSTVRVMKSRRLKWAGHVSRKEESRTLTGKPTGKRLLGRPRRRWEDIVRLDLKEIVVYTRHLVGSVPDSANWRALVNSTLTSRSLNHGVI